MTAAGIAKQIVWATGTQVSCSVTEVLDQLTSSNAPDAGLMQFARATKLYGNPRAQEYLSHYLNGTGTPKSFALWDLLGDAGAKAVVGRFLKAAPQTCMLPVITIRQRDYEQNDWRNALGTYFIYFIEVGHQKNRYGRATRHVLAWGEDTYRWHPDDSRRISQCVHQAAERLRGTKVTGTQRAAEFKMITPPTLVDTETVTVSAAGYRCSVQDEMARRRIGRQSPVPMCR